MRNLMWAVLAAGCLLAGGGVASAQDTVRLGGPSAQAEIQGGTNTDLVHWGRGYYGGGYGRGYYGGGYGRGYYGGGFYGRGYYGGGYYGRGYYGGYYRPYYYGAYYAPSYYYPQTYYYTPSYYPATQYYYYPIAGEGAPPPETTVQGNYQAPPPNGDGTYQYDGGPRSTVPMPNSNEPPRGVIPIDGKLVSLPTQISGGTSSVGIPAAPRTSESRAIYPAYGEEPIAPAPRKTSR